MRTTRSLLVAGALWAVWVEAPVAQESRAALIEKEQAAKAQATRPYDPGKIEKVIGYLDRHDLVDRFTEGDGFFPFIGGISTGGGLAFGGGYRRHVAGYRGVVEASGAASLKGYRQAVLTVAFPDFFRGRLEVGGDVKFRWFPQEDFYGIGFDTLNEDRVSYSLDGSDYSGVAAVRPVPWLATGIRVGYLHTTLGEGTDSRFPSIDEAFTDATAPGLAEQPDYLYRELFADLDTRDEPGNPRSGGYYRAAWTRYSDRDLNRFDFSRFTAEASRFFPLFDKKRVFLVRGRLTITDPDEGHVVPFYLLPTLGGSNTLRSVNDFRFRDNDLLFLNVEYRWEAFSNLDMALFADAGKVAFGSEDFDLGGMKHAYGLGFRFNTHRDIVYRIDIAHGDEGFKVFFKFSGPFRDRAHWPTDTRALKHRR